MKREPGALLIILLLATVMRTAPLFQVMWFDEAYTALLAEMPVGAMLGETLNDVHPPLFYLIEIGSRWLFGRSEAAIRFPSFVLGVLSVYLIYRLALRLFDRRVALVSAGVAALQPFLIYYSVEARMYALLLAAVLAASLGAVERRGWLLALGTAVALLSHNLGALYVPGLALLAWLYRGEKSSCRSLLPIGVGALPFAGWLPFMFKQMTTGQFSDRYWITYFTGNSFSRTLAELIMLWGPQFRPEQLSRLAALVTFSLVLFPSIAAIRARHRAAIIALAVASLPVLFELGISIAWQPIVLARTLIGIMPAWIMLIAWWVLQPRQWTRARLGLIGLAALVVLASTLALYSWPRNSRVIEVMDFLNSNTEPGDVVCHVSDSTAVWFWYYYRGRSMTVTDDNASECDWLYDERYIMPGNPRLDTADKTIALRDGRVAYVAMQTDVIQSAVYRLK